MKKTLTIAISYPPLHSGNKTPFLSQNRQFQWTNTGNVIYPVIPAYAATLLKKNNFKVIWDDAIVTKKSYQEWFANLNKQKPDIVVIETKTPVIKKHWQIINQIKKGFLKKPLIVLMGDHVTALPKESFDHSLVDYVLTGGDYDFMLLNLAKHISQGTKLESGFYYKKGKKILNSGKFGLKHHDLDQLPIIDRDLTQWQLYSINNTNFKYKPGAYIMSGRDCWWGKCQFCSWTTLFPHSTYRHFSVKHTIQEIENLVSNYQVREIFDDSGTLPIGEWLIDLCHNLIKKGLNKKVVLGCNLRFGALTEDKYQIMSQAGFRFILYGLESANPKTIEKINKNIKFNDIESTLKTVKKLKMEPHVTLMIGYPWETKKEAQNTLKFAKNLFKQSLVDSMQATLMIPYPGTPLYNHCLKNNLLLTHNWEKFDMQQPVMKSPISKSDQLVLIKSLFTGIITPKFILNKISSIRNFSDIKHLITYTYKFLLKLKDFHHD